MPLTQKQIDELNVAAERVASGRPGSKDQENLDYARKMYGYGGPSISREGGGYNIQNAPSYKFDLNDFKNKTVLSEAAKEIIQRKQGFNKDIQGARQWVRGVGADTSPFGGQRDPALSQAGMFTDERMRELSPEDQASIRASRSSSLQAYGRGLQEEATYRQSRVDDTLNTFKDLYDEAMAKGANELEAQKVAIDRMKVVADAKAAGYSVDKDGNFVKDLSNVNAGQIAETLRSVLTNGNYSTDVQTGKIGAYKIPLPLWEQWSGEFSESQGQGPMLLDPTPENQDVLAQWKIQQLLNKGYSPEDIMAVFYSGNEDVQGGKWKDIEGAQQFIDQGSRSLQYLSPMTTSGGGTLEMTEAKKFSLLEALGTDENGQPIMTVDELNRLSTNELAILESSVRQAKMEQATLAIGEWASNNQLTGAQIFAKLQKEYGNALNSADLNAVMVGAGYQNSGDIFSGTWQKIQ